MKPQLIIDTDPGVDDALAILMAYQFAEVHALTVVAGNTGLAHTLRNACRLVDLHGASTPVYPGCADPLVRAPDEDAAHVHGSDGFGDVGLAEPAHKPEAEPAAQALVRMARERPGELTLVALGPLTNLALAVRLDPEFPRNLTRLVIMGGAVNGHGNLVRPPVEFNLGFDAEAAHVVFGAFEQFELVDWELTLRHAFADAAFDAWLAAGDRRADLFGRIIGCARAWNAAHGRHGIIAADALAMAVALDPDIVQRSEHHPVAIELEGRLTRGMTVVDRERRSFAQANAHIAMQLDQARFAHLVASALGVPEAMPRA